MRQNKKILLIEDEDLTRQMYLEAFEKRNYYLYQAKNQKEALEILKSVKPAVVILDLLIPEEAGRITSFDLRIPGGLSVLEEIRKDESLKNTKVVIITALENEQVKIAAQAAGVDAYYIKTEITPGEFAEKIIALAEQR